MSVEMMEKRIAEIRASIAEAAQMAGRSPEDITLLAVTKTVPVEHINEAISAGVDVIGENRVQEFLQKAEELLPCHRHFIGTLQSNKAGKLVGKVEMVHSLSKRSTADALEKACEREDTTLDVLLQVNIGNEDSKDGVAPQEIESFVKYVSEMKYLRPRGLMTVPPISEGNVARVYFAKLRALQEKMKWVSEKSGVSFDQLSMGMSHDFREAIMEGATIVRVGTALFGERDHLKI